jgi:hypothetical protein
VNNNLKRREGEQQRAEGKQEGIAEGERIATERICCYLRDVGAKEWAHALERGEHLK